MDREELFSSFGIFCLLQSLGTVTDGPCSDSFVSGAYRNMSLFKGWCGVGIIKPFWIISWTQLLFHKSLPLIPQVTVENSQGKFTAAEPSWERKSVFLGKGESGKVPRVWNVNVQVCHTWQ